MGINYWPITSAMYWWQRFDTEQVERDFARISEAKFDSMRIFLLWEDFQPAPDRISEQSLANLVRVADIARHNNLSLVPTLFTGHMSGANWIPAWAVEPDNEPVRFRVISGGKVVRAKLKNWYSDEWVIDAQSLLARAVAGALRNHPAVWAYDLGSKNSNCVLPASQDEGIRWLKRMAGEIRSVDSSPLITIGLHMGDLEEDRLIGPREATTVCDFLSIHGYPIYAEWAWEPTDGMVLPFLGLITQWMGNHVDVLFEEFGAPTVPLNAVYAAEALESSPVRLLSEYETANFTGRALEQLQRFGLIGAMLWCYGDYAEELCLKPPLDEAVHERYFGLWHNNYSIKPALVEVEQISGEDQSGPPDDFEWIDISVDEYYLSPRENLSRLYEIFRQRFIELR
jgi:endo-1,4-beta-mannosidase